MASQTITKLQAFKRGDTPTFTFVFNPPFVGYNWNTVTVDCAMTNVASPSDNSGAAAIRINQMLTVNSTTNVASWSFSLTHTESSALIPGTTYHIEPQLKEATAGQPNYASPVTASVEVLQDYTI